MLEIIKVKYDFGGSWFSSHRTLEYILKDKYTPELFIIAMNEKKEKDFMLLSDLSGKKVKVGKKNNRNSLTRIP